MSRKKQREESEPSGKMNPSNVTKQQKPEKLFFLAGHHSRNSSTSSSLSSETEREVREEKEDKEKGCRITGGCLCKISLLVYLVVCILVSALYVAIYGQNQPLFGEVWIPGKVCIWRTITRGWSLVELERAWGLATCTVGYIKLLHV